jgi:uncharacterized YkwD family protein
MKKISKVLIGIQIGILMTAVALPVQAAINIGAPRPSSGSVVTIRSSTPVTTQVTPAPTPTQVTAPSTQRTQTTVSTQTNTYVQNQTTATYQSVKIGLPNSSGNVVSLKSIIYQPNTIPVTAAPAPIITTSPFTISSTDTPPTTPTLPVIPAVTSLTADEQLMVDMINQERIAAGVSPVKLDLRLASVGRAKANDLKANNYFDHTSPTYGSPWVMMQQVGLSVHWAGENISGNKSVEGSMAALMLSPGHRANILDPRFTHIGVGIAYGSAYGNLYVQEFLQE